MIHRITLLAHLNDIIMFFRAGTNTHIFINRFVKLCYISTESIYFRMRFNICYLSLKSMRIADII